MIVWIAPEQCPREACALYTGLGNKLRTAHCRYILGTSCCYTAMPPQPLPRAEGAQPAGLACRQQALSRSCALRVMGQALLALTSPQRPTDISPTPGTSKQQLEDPYDQLLILAAQAETAWARGDPGRTRAEQTLALAHEERRRRDPPNGAPAGPASHAEARTVGDEPSR